MFHSSLSLVVEVVHLVGSEFLCTRKKYFLGNLSVKIVDLLYNGRLICAVLVYIFIL